MSLQLNQPPFVNDRETSRFYQQLYDFFRLVGTRTIDIGSIAAGVVSTFTITVTGAKVDMNQTVEIAAPSGLDAGLVWCGNVTADDTVTVRVHNTTGGAIDPASATWGARVTR
jgi:hypothetical protein